MIREYSKKVIEIIIHRCVDAFIRCADDECFFQEALKIMRGFMINDYYKTIKEQFCIEGVRNSFK